MAIIGPELQEKQMHFVGHANHAEMALWIDKARLELEEQKPLCVDVLYARLDKGLHRP